MHANCCFFFQAEDGIRDYKVTGVQTCALPISIDGSMNNGFGRRIASSPNSDQIEEVRIETANFDASQGHGTGLSISMMTRGGTNTLRGSANYTYWHNRLNSPNLQQKVAWKQDPRVEKAWRAGREHIGAFTLGGPLVIPKIIDGRGKAFFFEIGRAH